jgi:hypothetical protein
VSFDEAPEFIQAALLAYVEAMNVTDKLDKLFVQIGFTKPILHGQPKEYDDVNDYKRRLQHKLAMYKKFITDAEVSLECERNVLNVQEMDANDFMLQFLARYSNLKLGMYAVENNLLMPSQAVFNQFMRMIFDVETALIRLIQVKHQKRSA